MATISKSWGSEVHIYQTDAYSGSDADVTTIVYTDNVDLETNGYEGAVINIKFDGDNATDDLQVSVYSSMSSSHDTDEVPVYTYLFDSDGSEMIYTIVVKDLAHFYLGLARSGTSTTFDIDVSYRAWRWTVA